MVYARSSGLGPLICFLSQISWCCGSAPRQSSWGYRSQAKTGISHGLNSWQPPYIQSYHSPKNTYIHSPNPHENHTTHPQTKLDFSSSLEGSNSCTYRCQGTSKECEMTACCRGLAHVGLPVLMKRRGAATRIPRKSRIESLYSIFPPTPPLKNPWLPSPSMTPCQLWQPLWIQRTLLGTF